MNDIPVCGLNPEVLVFEIAQGSGQQAGATRKASGRAAGKAMRDFWGNDDRSRVVRFTPRRASAGSECEVIHAGTIPKTIPVSKEMPIANPITGSDGVA